MSITVLPLDNPAATLKPGMIANLRLARQTVSEALVVPQEAVVPPLGHPRGVARGLLLLRIEVDVEMRRLEDPEVERLVLHLVLSEVLRGQRRSSHGRSHGRPRQEQQQAGAKPMSLHEPYLLSILRVVDTKPRSDRDAASAGGDSG